MQPAFDTHAQDPMIVKVRKKLDDGVGLLINHIYLLILLLVITGTVMIIFSFYQTIVNDQVFTYIIQQIGTSLLASSVITMLGKLFVVKYSDKFMKEKADDYTKEVLVPEISKHDILIDDKFNQFDGKLSQTVAEIESDMRNLCTATALLQNGATQIYADRPHASVDIAQSLTHGDVTEIRMIGISLKDLLDSNQPIHEAWETIEKYITGNKQPPSGSLDIKVMAVDPYCLGAQVRLHGEQRNPLSILSNLEDDVLHAVTHMQDLKQAYDKQKPKQVNFAFKLYRLAPSFALWHTDHVSYIQPYYLWAKPDTKIPIPVIRYDRAAEARQEESFHSAMEYHFDWIWDRAAVTALEWKEAQMIGWDKSLIQSRALNVFTKRAATRARIKWLIEHAQSRVYLLGVSLPSFFGPREVHDDTSPFPAILESVNRGVEVKVLLLDPDCDQARYVSFHEYIRRNQRCNVTFEDYKHYRYHIKSDLYRTIQVSRETIREHFMSNPKFQVKLYTSAPTCFLLIVDDNVLIEQYHYGSAGKNQPTHDGDSRSSFAVGRDVPVMEFTKTNGDPNHDDPRFFIREHPRPLPFDLLLNHFNFVFDHCATAEERSTKPPAPIPHPKDCTDDRKPQQIHLLETKNHKQSSKQ